MDYSMPDCDGNEATRAILSLLAEFAPELPRPMICSTLSLNGKESVDLARAAGADKILVKPLFLNAVHRLLLELKDLSLIHI